MINLCTYFDSNYLGRATACYDSLMKFGNFTLYCLCFDEKAYKAFKDKKNVVAILPSELESYRPALLSVKPQRSAKEYYATTTSVFPQLLFDKFKISSVFYTDADMAFWSDPNEMTNIFGNKSLMVSAHENKVAHAAGYFNVGVLGYRNDRRCIKFLKWWEDRCMEWCEWAAPKRGFCADQGYLNVIQDEPKKFKGTLICPNPGVNLGPWNLAMHKISKKGDKLLVDDKHNLICYHYHGYDDKVLNNTGWNITAENKNLLYIPYRNMLRGVK